ncbi:MAG: histidine kinase [Planctomycetes bacterium]|nr:histidine kinase [Planctomycetota bacterium]
MSELDDIVRDFLVESHEGLDRLDNEMVVLEERPDEKETLASIFRTIHTIKGSSGFLGFGKLGKVAHAGENLLAKLRDGTFPLDNQITDSLLAMFDAVRKILERIEQTGGEGDEDYSTLVQQLTLLLDGRKALSVAATPTPPPDSAAPALFGEALVAKGVTSATSVARALEVQRTGDPPQLGEILVEHGAIQPQHVVETLREQSEQRGAALTDQNIRVDVSLLDRLMNLVGELVLARNQILQFKVQQEDAQFIATTQRLNLVTTELQAGVMKTRMQPIGNVWGKFPRVVRDLAKSCGKQVRLELVGKETELDKTIIEAIKDPLTHIVRNSIDHGIERPEVRVAAGKAPEGVLAMRAYHEGGQVNIEIKDDGAGIAAERLKAKALEKELVTAEEVARMGERELLNLIFLPGLSTAAKVTDVSGRGVGMDVVRTNIERIGGTVDVFSERGRGTTLRIKIPLTLAIIPALVVTASGHRFAIPQVSLLELVRLEADEVQREIEDLHGAPVYRLRGRLLPLLNLRTVLAFGCRKDSEAAVNIVVLQADGRQFGLLVDEINDTEEIVVKPLGKLLKGLTTFAGATIMGDGRVALILDVQGISQGANLITASTGHSMLEDNSGTAQAKNDRSTLLLFRAGESRRLAIPLSDVARLEEFGHKTLERAGDRAVVQYRGEILPLLHVSSLMGDAKGEWNDPCQVVVYSNGGRSVGLVVENILDIVEESYVVQTRARSQGVLGSTVIQGRVTDLLDVDHLLRQHDPGFFVTTTESAPVGT